MSTVTDQNYKELPELTKLCLSIGVKRFDFSRLVPYGEASKSKLSLTLSPQEYRLFLQKMHKVYIQAFNKGIHTSTFGTKDPLWSLFLSNLTTYLQE